MSNYLNGQGMDISLRDYVDVFHRRRAIIIQTCVLMIAIGFIINLVTKPRYLSSTRIVLEGKSSTPTTYDADNPLADLFLQDLGHSIATQVGIIQGEEVLSQTARECGVPMDSVDATVTPVQGTDLVDIEIVSENQANAFKFAKQLPTTYKEFTKTNQTEEIMNAHALADSQRLDAERKLRAIRRQLAKLRETSGIFDVSDDLKMRGEALAASASALQSARRHR